MEIRVRYAECDPMNVAHHGAYPVWLEIARTELLRLRGTTYRQIEEAGTFIVVARLEIRYRLPAFYDDLLSVEVELEGGAGVKIEHRYRIFRGEEFLAQARTTLVCVDRQGRMQPVPPFLLAPVPSA